MELPTSLFDKVISRPRSLQVMRGIVIILFLPPILAMMAEYGFREFLTQAEWRGLLIPPTVILYILIVAPRLSRMESSVLTSFRKISLVDDDAFGHLVYEASATEPRKELLAISAGVVIGLIAGSGSTAPTFSWTTSEWLVSNLLMFGLLGWTVYVSFVSTRLTAILLRQPFHVDPLDTTPFEAIGRQSLMLALVFMGGISISLVFVAFDLSSFLRWELWLIYIALALVPAIIFFLNMIPTHRVLTAAKVRELQAVRSHIHRSYRDLLEHPNHERDTGNLPAEISALASYEQHLQMARTWPYNTAILRNLFFSILIPVGTLLGRIIVEVMFN